jgi:hypothetical protein
MKFRAAPSVVGSNGKRRSTARAALAHDEVSKFSHVKPLCPTNTMVLANSRGSWFTTVVSALTGEAEESHDVSAFFNSGGEL